MLPSYGALAASTPPCPHGQTAMRARSRPYRGAVSARHACASSACQAPPLPHAKPYWRTLSQGRCPPRARGASPLFEHQSADPGLHLGPKASALRNSRCRLKTPQSAWLSHFVGVATAQRAHKHLFAYVPSAGGRTLRTHVLFITQTRSAAASCEDVAAGPLFPVARGRLRRRLGGRPGRVDHRVSPMFMGGLRR